MITLKRISTLALTLMFIVSGVLISGKDIGAISYLGPDPADYGDSNATYIVAHTPNNTTRDDYNQTLLRVPIYYNNPDANGDARAPTNDTTLRVYDITRGVSGYDPRNQYISVEINDRTPQPGSHRFYAARDVAVRTSDFTLDDSADGTMLYRAVVNIRLYNGLSANLPDWRYMNQVRFRLRLTDYRNRWIIGNSIPNGRFSTLAANNSPGQRTDTYRIPFATPCKITTRTSGIIHLYDLDDNGPDNENHNITYRIVRANGTTVSYTASGSGGDGGDRRLTMTFEPLGSYHLVISGISPINLLQYSFPYEGVNSLVKCTDDDDPGNYDLNPRVSLAQTGAIEPDSTVRVTPSVENTGALSSPATTEWELRRTVGSNPAAELDSGSQSFTANNTTTLARTDDSDTDYAVGTELCYTLRVRPYATGANVSTWRESERECVKIGKKPKTQIWGGDLNVRGNVITSTSDKSGRRYGSWAEYGIIASGGITGAASGAAFAGPTGMAVGSVCGHSTLSFANTTGTSCGSPTVAIGSYSNANNIPDVGSSFPSSRLPSRGSISGTISPAGLASGTYTATDLTLSASNLPAGRSIIIKATGLVAINGNQTYSGGPYTRISQLPQLVIIADRIRINRLVTTVDAWLIAQNGSNNSIATCNMAGSDSGQCAQRLTVNGPVMADHLYLRRTAGSGTSNASGDPAEVFNLRADAYLWAQYQAAVSGRARTVYTTELPPRF